MAPQGGEEAMNPRAIQALETLCQRYRLSRAALLADFNNTSSQAVWGQINYWSRERQILDYDEAKRLLYLGHAQNPSRGLPRVPSDPNRWIPTDIEEADEIYCREVFSREGVRPRLLPGLGRVRSARNRRKSPSTSPVIPGPGPAQVQESAQEHRQLQQFQNIQQEEDPWQGQHPDQQQDQGDTIIAAAVPQPLNLDIDPGLQHVTSTFQLTPETDDGVPMMPSRRSTRTSVRKRRHHDSPPPSAPSNVPAANDEISPVNDDTPATPAATVDGQTNGHTNGQKPAVFTDMSAAQQLLAFQNGAEDSDLAAETDSDQAASQKRRRTDQETPNASSDAYQPVNTAAPVAYKEDEAISFLVDATKSSFVQKLHQYQDLMVAMAGHQQRLAKIDQALGKVTSQLEDATKFLAERREMLVNIESKRQMTQAGMEAAEFKVWQENHPALAAQVVGPMKLTLTQLAEDKKEIEYQIKDKTMEMEPLLEEKEEGEQERKVVIVEAGFPLAYQDGDIENSLDWLKRKIEDLKAYLFILGLGPSRVGEQVREHGGVGVDTSVYL
ncbi:hypothetical protein QC761_611510 [Podospora bellae-mahoneyi]|uniref:Uncharacterized protein n=1 Tax=Podospora bellae-mahoneyi TaxID=2093777 RepID=A0ABR0F7Q2_9PEZI|nr:hypothetical protein QC761_611510 [Podospora bellae-mahoneyi]